MPALEQPTKRIICNPWAEALYHYPSPYDYRIVYGGRGSSKTNEFTRALIVHGHMREMRIAVAREHKVSIEESAQPELLARAGELRLLRPDCYVPTRSSIDHKTTGSHFFFLGLSVVSEEDIRGLANVDILWIEEAHKHVTQFVGIGLIPPYEKTNSEVWISFNPKYRTEILPGSYLENRGKPRYSGWSRNQLAG